MKSHQFFTISFLFDHRLFKKIRSGLMQGTLIAAFFMSVSKHLITVGNILTIFLSFQSTI